MTLRVGIMSANWGAFAHLPAWRSVPGVEVVAICTSRRETAEAAAKRCGIASPFWDAQAMAAHPDIDILDCGTRPSVRDPVVASALRNGKHVYNAIPFATNIDRARELRDTWKASGKIGVVDAFIEWLPAHRLVKEMLDDGFLGQPFGGTCMFHLSLFNKPNPHFPYNWFWQAGLGVSALRNLGSHALHMLIFLFGGIDELVAHDGQLLHEWRFADGSAIKPETNDFASLLLRFHNGLVIQLQVSWSSTVAPGSPCGERPELSHQPRQHAVCGYARERTDGEDRHSGATAAHSGSRSRLRVRPATGLPDGSIHEPHGAEHPGSRPGEAGLRSGVGRRMRAGSRAALG